MIPPGSTQFAFEVMRWGQYPPASGEATIATLLKGAGYATAAIGKRGLGAGGLRGRSGKPRLRPVFRLHDRPPPSAVLLPGGRVRRAHPDWLSFYEGSLMHLGNRRFGSALQPGSARVAPSTGPAGRPAFPSRRDSRGHSSSPPANPAAAYSKHQSSRDTRSSTSGNTLRFSGTFRSE